MRTLLAVDPGIRGAGVAFFVDEVLVESAYVKSAVKTGNTAAECRAMAEAIEAWASAYAWAGLNEIALEWPRVYATRIREGKSKADPNDLLALCGVDAAIATMYPGAKVTCYAPSDWKGQLTKEACHARIRSRLSPAEIVVGIDAGAAAKSLAHNMWDAVGIALHHVGRLERRRVIAA